MKKYYIQLLAFSVLISSAITCVAWPDNNIANRLQGYIEVVSDFGIRRIYLPSGKSEAIIKKSRELLVRSFDTFANGSERIVSDENGKLLLVSGNNPTKTIDQRGHEPSLSVDGRYIAFVSGIERISADGKELSIPNGYLFVMNSDGTNIRQVSRRPFAPEYRPSWFPNGKQIAMCTKDNLIFIVDVANGTEKMIIDFGVAPTVSRDGKKIAYLTNDVDTSIKKQISDFRNFTSHEYQAFIKRNKPPDGSADIDQYLLKHSIYIYDVETHKAQKLSDTTWIEDSVVWSPENDYLLYNDRAYVSRDIYILDVKSGEKKKLDIGVGGVAVWRQ